MHGRVRDDVRDVGLGQVPVDEPVVLDVRAEGLGGFGAPEVHAREELRGVDDSSGVTVRGGHEAIVGRATDNGREVMLMGVGGEANGAAGTPTSSPPGRLHRVGVGLFRRRCQPREGRPGHGYRARPDRFRHGCRVGVGLFRRRCRLREGRPGHGHRARPDHSRHGHRARPDHSRHGYRARPGPLSAPVSGRRGPVPAPVSAPRGPTRHRYPARAGLPRCRHRARLGRPRRRYPNPRGPAQPPASTPPRPLPAPPFTPTPPRNPPPPPAEYVRQGSRWRV